MARKKQPANNGVVLFDIVYQDGARTSNRKVPVAELAGPDPELQARVYIETQDRKIAGLSGKPRGAIKSIKRSPAQ